MLNRARLVSPARPCQKPAPLRDHDLGWSYRNELLSLGVRYVLVSRARPDVLGAAAESDRRQGLNPPVELLLRRCVNTVMEMCRPVEARGLVKRYGAIAAVAGVDVTVEPGGIHGYLGRNGAGKTTTLRMLLGLVRPDAGRVRLFGRDPFAEGGRALEGVAGFVEAPAFYPYLSGRENLELLATLDRNRAGVGIDEALELVELRDRAGDRVSDYSQGMRQRLGHAASLLRRPRLLLLDEPTNGLDPAGIRDMRVLMRRLAGEGMTIVYSSHLLAEVEEICDRVTVLDRGRVVYEGGLDELRRVAGELYRLDCTDPPRALALSRTLKGIERPRLHEGSLRFAAAGEAAVEELTVMLGCGGIGMHELVRERASLEALFFRLTGTAADRSDASESLP